MQDCLPIVTGLYYARQHAVKQEFEYEGGNLSEKFEFTVERDDEADARTDGLNTEQLFVDAGSKLHLHESFEGS